MTDGRDRLPHGVHYVTRDGSATYQLDNDGAAARLAGDESEAAVAVALLSLAANLIRRQPKPAPDTREIN